MDSLYQPLACDLHDYLEIACLYHYRLHIELSDGDSLDAEALTTATTPSKEEFLIMLSAQGQQHLRSGSPARDYPTVSQRALRPGVAKPGRLLSCTQTEAGQCPASA